VVGKSVRQSHLEAKTLLAFGRSIEGANLTAFNIWKCLCCFWHSASLPEGS